MDRILAGGGRAARAGFLAAMALAPGARADIGDARADKLVAAMTLPEKLAMLHGQFAAFPDRPKPAGAIGSAGFVPGVKRLGIPDLQESDAGLGVTNPFGIRPGDTALALPSGLAMAASFDPEAAYEAGAALGRQAAQHGFNVVLGGGVDLVRDPRGGRSFEYAGEDPLLAGIMVGEAVRGTQDQHVVSTVKHFAVNDQETGRMVLSADVPQAALRESDLLAFEIAIERGNPGAVMCAYNRVNGVYACENPDLLTQVLKRDWRYPGWVMSDWGAVHGVDAINSGLDQESGEQFDAQVYFGAPLAQAVAAGHVTPARIDNAVHRILRSMIDVGLLDHAAPKPDPDADLAAARRAATEGIVLLSNHDLLPLPRSLHRVCGIGGQADAGVAAGGGSSRVMPLGGVARSLPSGRDVQPPSFGVQVFDPPSPLSRIQAIIPGAQVVFDDGRDAAAAAARARACEVAIVFVTNFSGEEVDLPDLALPAGQDALVQAVEAANARTIVVLETAGAAKMPWLSRAGAVLQAWYPGSAGADAIADILFGVAPPSGRLPVTFPGRENDLPNPALPGLHVRQGTAFSVTYPEGRDAGYAWAERHGTQPPFSFGYGLSTTKFKYTNFQVRGGRTLVAEFDISNIGTRAGVDVPQIYLTARGTTRMLRLLGWSRRRLERGETQHVVITADMRLLADFDTKARRWIMAAEAVRVGLGENAGDVSQSQDVVMEGLSIAP
jgi:beta-glucosidase